jgi:hypothetical protein
MMVISAMLSNYEEMMMVHSTPLTRIALVSANLDREMDQENYATNVLCTITRHLQRGIVMDGRCCRRRNSGSRLLRFWGVSILVRYGLC